MSKRDRILKAAAKTVSNVGIGNVTLEQVADEAGVSKGGLLYHFPSKQALLEGMVNYVLTQMNNTLREYQEEHNFSISYVLSTLNDLDKDEEISMMDKSALVAIANDRDLLTVMQNHYTEWMEQLRAENNEEAAVIIRLITSGLWLEYLVGVHSHGTQDREYVLRAVKELNDRQKHKE
ncbi:AcrR family transcriptional regulator [Geomicrobium halophilum]|uniref:AcrR family transcriptional regulator n=1 Tax=Geomicrobium halophilum TaxID=549000 RepID=A0A841Q0F9_9BACL|nr:TetR/AcrR family transcriptional regulator [Geomicrobium halophilum]MBB6451153.1 AcrR family transcriptional regulator [Geomicrobium halophilum]